jgi:hypothetical protein
MPLFQAATIMSLRAAAGVEFVVLRLDDDGGGGDSQHPHGLIPHRGVDLCKLGGGTGTGPHVLEGLGRMR